MNCLTPDHCSISTQVSQEIRTGTGDEFRVREAHPLNFDKFSVLAPDALTVRKPVDDPCFKMRHPNATEAVFLLEISGDSYAFGRSIKYAACAEAGIPDRESQ